MWYFIKGCVNMYSDFVFGKGLTKKMSVPHCMKDVNFSQKTTSSQFCIMMQGFW